MSTELLEIVLLWVPKSTDADYSELKKLLETEYANQFLLRSFTLTKQAIEYVQSRTESSRPLIVISKLGMVEESLAQPLIQTIRRQEKRTFIILHSHNVCADPNLRWHFAALGVNMITESVPAIRQILDRILPLGQSQSSPTYTCPYCGWSSLSFSQLYVHVPMYHTNEPPLAGKCEICQRVTGHIGVHLQEEHIANKPEGPTATPLYAYSLVVCQRKLDGRFLVVQEAGAVGYWLPGGRVEVGEQLDKAAERETLEEAGVKVRLTGILKIEFMPRLSVNRLRVIFFAEPLDENNCEPKTCPDYESYGAMWLTYEQVVQCNAQGQLRGNEPLKWFKYISQNGTVHPLSILSKTEH